MSKLGKEDARQWLLNIPDDSVDCVITDPPYWTLNKWREVGTTTRLGGHRDKSQRDEDKWFQTISKTDVKDIMHHIYRILKPDTHAYIFCDDETSDYIKSYAGDMLWTKTKRIVWDKVNIGMGYSYRCQHEFIIFLQKGKRKLNNLGISDVLKVKKIIKGYPTEKPVELIEVFVNQSTRTGETICDPFFGSGSTAIACKNLNRLFIGNDISSKAHNYFQRRLVHES